MPSTLNISLMALVQKASFSFLHQQSRISWSLPHSTSFRAYSMVALAHHAYAAAFMIWP